MALLQLSLAVLAYAIGHLPTGQSAAQCLHVAHRTMPSPLLSEISSESEHEAALAQHAALPAGFRVGSSGFEFSPAELDETTRVVMNLTLIVLDHPTHSFAAVFTRNGYPGTWGLLILPPP